MWFDLRKEGPSFLEHAPVVHVSPCAPLVISHLFRQATFNLGRYLQRAPAITPAASSAARQPDTAGPYKEYIEADVVQGKVRYITRGGIETAVNIGRKRYREILIELK